MTDLTPNLAAFHFIRPAVLVLLPVVAVLWWTVRRSRTRRELPVEAIAPHLRAALVVGGAGARRLQPIDGVAAVLLLATLGAAGPTWSRVPDPFVAQSAPLVVALKVTPSMEGTDVAPSRLERGKQKIRDLVELRAGGRTALVAYAGTAHAVVPMTEDPGVIVPYLEGLSPEVMPVEGDRTADALALARSLLEGEGGPGGILFVADAVDPADVAAIDGTDGPSVAVLAMLPEGVADRGLDALSAPVVAVTPDGSDVRRLDRLIDAAYQRAQLEDGDLPWEDRGHWLAIPAALIALLWFRRGVTMRWSLTLALALAMASPRAEAGVVDWFFTPDQQGQRAFDQRQYRRAAELFVDPLRRGYALYRDGQYDEAIAVLSRVETAQAAFISGMAALKGQHYRDGVRAFETALRRDPDFPGAEANLATARRIVDYIEYQREMSDTGEDRGAGADEVVEDNESGRGAETRIEAPTSGAGLLTTEQWMNTVDTRTGDFLRQRFRLEATRAGDGT